VLHFHSGQPLQNLSGVDNIARDPRALVSSAQIMVLGNVVLSGYPFAAARSRARRVSK
jgi:hypothetical protein